MNIDLTKIPDISIKNGTPYISGTTLSVSEMLEELSDGSNIYELASDNKLHSHVNLATVLHALAVELNNGKPSYAFTKSVHA